MENEWKELEIELRICKLISPAKCNDRKEVTYCHFAFCEGNSLEVKNCPYRSIFIGRELGDIPKE